MGARAIPSSCDAPARDAGLDFVAPAAGHRRRGPYVERGPARAGEDRSDPARRRALRHYRGVALRSSGRDSTFTTFLDGNRNGFRAGDVTRGVDPPRTSPERLRDEFRRISFGLLPHVSDLDGGTDDRNVG